MKLLTILLLLSAPSFALASGSFSLGYDQVAKEHELVSVYRMGLGVQLDQFKLGGEASFSNYSPQDKLCLSLATDWMTLKLTSGALAPAGYSEALTLDLNKTTARSKLLFNYSQLDPLRAEGQETRMSVSYESKW